MSCAFAMPASAGAPELEHHALAEAPAADLERHSEPPARRAEHKYACRQELGALGRQPVAPRDDSRRRGAELRHRPLEHLAVEHRPDQRRERGGAAADRYGVIGARHVGRCERRVGGGDHGVDVGARRRVLAAAAGQQPRSDRERPQPIHAARNRADRDLGRHPADVDDGDRALGRALQRPRRAGERQPALVVGREHRDVDPGAVAQRRDQRPAVRGAADRRGGDDPQLLRARRLGRGALGRDDVGDRRYRRLRNRPEAVDAVRDARERPLLEHGLEPPARRFGDQQPRRVRPDVDAGAAHGRAGKVAMMGADDQRRRDRGRRPAQGLRRPPRGPRDLVQRPPRRGVRAARAQRRRQDDDRRDTRGLPRAHRRPRRRARDGPRPAAAGAARADRDRAPVERALPAPDRARGGQSLGRLLPRAARRRGDDRGDGPGGRRGAPHGHALGRPAAAAGLRARARRRPRARLPRRAHDGLRPGRAAPGLGHGALAPAARQDGAADDALPRRGPGARRPRRDHQGRRHPRRGRAGGTGRRWAALSRRVARCRRGRAAARDRRPDDAAARADRRGARARRARRGAERHATQPGGRLPGADRGGARVSGHALDEPVRRARPQPASVAWHLAAWRQYRLERKMFWRNPSAAFFNFLLPLLFLALFGAIFSEEEADLQVIVPGIAGMAVMSTTFSAFAFNLTYLRESGVLKRVHGTPLPTSAYLAGIACNAVTNTALQVVLITAAGSLVFGLDWPHDWAALVVFGALGVICFASLGVALSHAIPNFDSAPAYVNAVFLPVIFISGVFYDADNAPGFLRAIAEVLPLKHLIDGLGGAMVTGEGVVGNASALLVLALWSMAGVVLAVRGFSWEARRA